MKITRLLTLGMHLSNIKNHKESDEFKIITFYPLQDSYRVELETKCYSWIFDELPSIFSDCPYRPGDSDMEIIPGIFDFLSLSDEEFCHLFDLNGHQNTELFGGKKITEESNISDIAQNIIELAKRRKV